MDGWYEGANLGFKNWLNKKEFENNWLSNIAVIKNNYWEWRRIIIKIIFPTKYLKFKFLLNIKSLLKKYKVICFFAMMTWKAYYNCFKLIPFSGLKHLYMNKFENKFIQNVE